VSLPTTLLSSSVVERSAVNRLVVGSNPTSGAILPSPESEALRVLILTDASVGIRQSLNDDRLCTGVEVVKQGNR
jgi:hypothetical protein